MRFTSALSRQRPTRTRFSGTRTMFPTLCVCDEPPASPPTALVLVLLLVLNAKPPSMPPPLHLPHPISLSRTRTPQSLSLWCCYCRHLPPLASPAEAKLFNRARGLVFLCTHRLYFSTDPTAAVTTASHIFSIKSNNLPRIRYTEREVAAQVVRAAKRNESDRRLAFDCTTSLSCVHNGAYFTTTNTMLIS